MSFGTIFFSILLRNPLATPYRNIISYLCISPSYTYFSCRCVFFFSLINSNLPNPVHSPGNYRATVSPPALAHNQWLVDTAPCFKGTSIRASPETKLELFFSQGHIHTELSSLLFSFPHTPFPEKTIEITFSIICLRCCFQKSNPNIFPDFSRPILRQQPQSWICLFHCLFIMQNALVILH